jgi:hypothetical protein
MSILLMYILLFSVSLLQTCTSISLALRNRLVQFYNVFQPHLVEDEKIRTVTIIGVLVLLTAESSFNSPVI